LARHTPLGILTDLDGTLIPFAHSPRDARLPAETAKLLDTLADMPGVRLALVSGRSRDSLEEALPPLARSIYLVAEHGAWLRGEGAWQALAEPLPDSPAQAVAALLGPVVGRFPGAWVEPKSWSVAVHFRGVSPFDRMAIQVEVGSTLEGWLDQHPCFALVEGADSVEIRPTRIRKATAVSWMRNRAGSGARLLVLGDDVTDEDMFAAMGAADEGVLVGDVPTRPTRARWRMDGPAEAVGLLSWLAAVRAEAPTAPQARLPEPMQPAVRGERATTGPDLLVISNRLPEFRSPVTPDDPRRRNVGGLVSALEPILKAKSGIWLGWSGRYSDEPDLGPVGMDETAEPPIAWLDFPRRWADHYYAGFCNRALWPLFHSFPGRVHLENEDWECYVEANDAFASVAERLVPAGAAVWVHDYHLLLAARALRSRGHHGPIGHFLHIPFPSPDLLSILPWAEELLDAMLEFDLLGFQTRDHVENFRQCVGTMSPARVSDDAVEHRSRRTRIGAFPIGIIPENYSEDAPEDGEVAALLQALALTKLILGVDRLDYTKGIPARLRAFGRLLETVPEWRGQLSLVQVSVPSRADIPDYAKQRAEVESVVGRINGEYGDGRWVPVRYLYRSYSRQQLAQLYRAADVGLVTPLRDGMNLVAKEFVAAQDPAKPGVLVLSRFAGAAAELVEAVLTNPYHVDLLAQDLGAALRMSPGERRSQHARLLATVTRTTARTWAEDFLGTLLACDAGNTPAAAPAEELAAT
jgi:trehalose 6-phosphate synthase